MRGTTSTEQLKFMNNDREAGMLSYLTKGKAAEGTFKAKPEDFIVEEIPVQIPRNDTGKYLIIKVRLRNWETNRFVTYISRMLQINDKRITFAGTKDRNGITTQYFCLNYQGYPNLENIRDAEVIETFRSDRMLSLGDLTGNRFYINTSRLTEESRVRELNDEMNHLGGFPNFFGYQRFGSKRPITHLVGKEILKGDFKQAAMEYLCDPKFDTEPFRIDLLKTGDFERALKDFPKHLNYEHLLIQHVFETGEFEGAMEKLPRTLQMMFIHAYQSYLFNLILSKRMQEDHNLTEPHSGDYFVEVDQYFNPVSEPMKVNELNSQIIRKKIIEDRVRITLPLIGYNTDDSVIKQDGIRDIMENEGIDKTAFRVRNHKNMGSSGSQRIISAKPNDFSFLDGMFTFNLGKGIYATSYLREILKENMSNI